MMSIHAQSPLPVSKSHVLYLQASLQKELDTVQQSLVTKHEFLAKAKLSRIAHELQARSQQAVAAPAQCQSIDGRIDHRFSVPEARKRKHPTVSFKPLDASMASFTHPRPAAQCNVTSNASVASDNTSIFWNDIAPVQASTCIPQRPVPITAREAASRPAAQLKAVDSGRSKPKMRGFGCK